MISMSLSKAATATAADLIGHDVIFSGCSTDSRTIQPGNLFIALQGEQFDGHDYAALAEEKGASSLMLERELTHLSPVLKVANTRRAMGLLARCWREQMIMPLLAVTGSNGKTTVKEMLVSILSGIDSVHASSGNFNNDIGVPLSLFGLDKKHHYAVIEMGANHPGEIEWLSSLARPDVAVITQSAPAHLQGFGSIEGVARAKAEIYSGLQETGTAVINADDDYADFWKGVSSEKKQLTFGIDAKDADVYANHIETAVDNACVRFELNCQAGSTWITLPLSGRHNVMNSLAAAACCLSLDIPLTAIKTGLEKMSPVKRRLQIKPGKRSARLIDDTYNANPASLSAALDVLLSYQGQHYLVFGDMGELGEAAVQMHSDVGLIAKQAGIDGLFTIGELSRNASEAYGEGASHFASYQELNKALLDRLNDDTTLLIKGSRCMQMEQCVDVLTEEQ